MKFKPKEIIALFGPCCCGKSTIAQGLSGLGLSLVEVSEAVRLPSGRTPAETPWKDLSQEIISAFHHHGRAYFATQLVHQVCTIASNETVVVSGLRILEELEALQALCRVKSLGIFASYSTRVDRLCERQAKPADVARYVFERDIAEAFWGMPALFDYVGYAGTLFTDEMTRKEAIDSARSRIM